MAKTFPTTCPTCGTHAQRQVTAIRKDGTPALGRCPATNCNARMDIDWTAQVNGTYHD